MVAGGGCTMLMVDKGVEEMSELDVGVTSKLERVEMKDEPAEVTKVVSGGERLVEELVDTKLVVLVISEVEVEKYVVGQMEVLTTTTEVTMFVDLAGQ